MHRLLPALACALLLAACAPKPKGTWRASHPNGGQAALGMEITRDGKVYSGAMYVLDPNAPHNFTTAQRFPIKIHSADDHEILYSVEFLPHQPDELVLHLDKPVDGMSFNATMETTDGQSTPVDFEFDRVNDQ